jgi:hypothetical protein
MSPRNEITAERGLIVDSFRTAVPKRIAFVEVLRKQKTVENVCISGVEAPNGKLRCITPLQISKRLSTGRSLGRPKFSRIA